jgi:XTP/dITP diphosphohydrolase
MKILLASNNRNKLKEIKHIFAINKFDSTIILPHNLSPEKIEIEENGNTFAENAEIKAKGFFHHYKMPTLSDDSGLEVEALNGLPGLFSSRYAGENATDQTNRNKLIQELKLLGLTESPAQFRCTICYFDGTNTIFAEGICKGKVITEEMGKGGFGYDPMFIPDGFNKTFSQIDEFVKNKISHRAIAITKFINNFNEHNLTTIE